MPAHKRAVQRVQFPLRMEPSLRERLKACHAELFAHESLNAVAEMLLDRALKVKGY